MTLPADHEPDLPRFTGWLPDDPPTPKALEQALLTAKLDLYAPAKEGRIARAPLLVRQIDGTCTCFASMQGVWGIKGVQLSPYAGYSMALYKSWRPINPLQGISVGVLERELRTHGMCRWEHWNPTTQGFATNKRPGLMTRLRAQKFNIDSVRLHGKGKDFIDQVCAAIDRGYPPRLVVASRSLRPDASGVLPPLSAFSNPGRIDHMMIGWEYRSWQDGRREVFAQNSWGDWGLGGGCWLDEERLVQSTGQASYVRGAS